MIEPNISYGILIWRNAHPSILRKTVLLENTTLSYIFTKEVIIVMQNHYSKIKYIETS